MNAITMSKVKTLDVDTNALIRPLRELCGLTQEQFAARLGVTAVTVNRWENYRAKPMPLALQQVKSLLIEVNQSRNAAVQEAASLLLKQYFPKNF